MGTIVIPLRWRRRNAIEKVITPPVLNKQIIPLIPPHDLPPVDALVGRLLQLVVGPDREGGAFNV